MLSAFRKHLNGIEQIRGKFKWAIIVNIYEIQSGVKLFKTLASDGEFSIKLFENKDQAERWINKGVKSLLGS